MKKLIIGLCVLAISAVSFAILTDSGQIAVNVSATTDISTPPTYPTNIATGTPAAVSEGAGCTNVIVVNQIGITDNSTQGWTLNVLQTNGNLLHTTSANTIAYTLQINNVSGTLGTGLTMAPAVDTDLTFVSLSEDIACTGTATTATTGYTFDLRMSVTNLVMAGKLAGDYAETLSFTLASNGL